MEGCLTVYFVDRQKIEQTLKYIETQLQLFKENTTNWESAYEKLALERIAHTVIESILDVGNAMIDGFIMRDPGSYEDIINVLEDEKVITVEMAKGLKTVIHCRKTLVQDYIEVNHDTILTTLQKNEKNLNDFPVKVRDYLENELGPVSAFQR